MPSLMSNAKCLAFKPAYACVQCTMSMYLHNAIKYLENTEY